MERILSEGVRAASLDGVTIEPEYLIKVMEVDDKLFNYKPVCFRIFRNSRYQK